MDVQLINLYFGTAVLTILSSYLFRLPVFLIKRNARTPLSGNPLGIMIATAFAFFIFAGFYLVGWSPYRNSSVQSINYIAEGYLFFQMVILFIVAKLYKEKMGEVLYSQYNLSS